MCIKTDGTLWSWGYNPYGQLGLGDTTQRNSPVQIGSETYWASAYFGQHYAAALTNTNELYVWGYNGQGQLGLGDTINRSSPVQLGA